MQMAKSKEPVIQATNVTKHFPVMRGFVDSILSRGEQKYVHAVDDVTFNINKGETFGLVGESGCGKTTTGLLILQLMDRTGGKILFKGTDVSVYTRGEYNKFVIKKLFKFITRKESWGDIKEKIITYRDNMKNLRKEIQIIFQNPYDSLSPRFSVLDIVAEPLRLLKVCKDEAEIEEKVSQELESVGLFPAKDFINRFPHELSGGQRQRVGVARAFILDPVFIVADEPVSMLDVSVRVGVLRIMNELTKERETAFLFITHDLALARVMCDRIAVMYLGRIVEQGPTEDLIQNPIHPYTKALIAAVPKPDPDAHRTEDLPITGEVPSGIDIPSGCRFHPRCPYVAEECKQTDPQLEEVKKDYKVACIRYKDINNI